MKSFTPPPIPEEVIEHFRSRKEGGLPREQLIVEMRSAGLHIIECIKLTRAFYGLSTNDAKEIVHFSEAWADLREAHDAFHENVIQALGQDGWIITEEVVPVTSAPAA